MSVHSYLVCDMIATRSPGEMPAAISPLASACTSSLNWTQLMSSQLPSAALRRSVTARGCSAARRVTTSARFADGGDVRQGGNAVLAHDLSLSSSPIGPRTV